MHARQQPPIALLWVVVFVAVLGHMPALASYFAQDDWSFLARGSGAIDIDRWPARIVSSFLYWKLTWPLFGMSAPGYHGTALLLAAALALLATRLAGRLGLSTSGAVVTGLVCAATPVVVLPVFWVSATGELLAAVLALATLDRWLAGGGRNLGMAILLATLAMFAKECALGLPLALAILPWVFPHDESLRRDARWRAVALAAMALAAVAAGAIVWHAIPHGPGRPYELGGLGAVARNLTVYGGWLVSPWRFAPIHFFGLRAFGLLLWLGWTLFAWQRARDGDRRPTFALLWTLLVLAPVLILEGHQYPYYLTLAVPAWGWTLGMALGPRLQRLAEGRFGRGNLPALGVFVLAIACTTLAWSSTRARLTQRNPAGELSESIVRRVSIALEASRRLAQLPLADASELIVLQATRRGEPTDGIDPGRPWEPDSSPLHQSLAGTLGLSMLVPEGVGVQWTGHLDDALPGSLVLLDAGDNELRSLGPLENARIYSALIAISAGQHDRGRHDLWSVIGRQGATVRFAFDGEALPIAPADLKAEAGAFVTHLQESDSPSARRVLRLFEQVYAAVQEEPLFAPAPRDATEPRKTDSVPPWGRPLKGIARPDGDRTQG